MESYQSSVDSRKDLEQRVSNGVKLDTAYEATLSKLTAAHESNNKKSRDNYQRPVMKKRWCADEDSKLAKLVRECNSTKTKWTELSQHMENRTAKQCRNRYNNCLKPDRKDGQWTEGEDMATNGASSKISRLPAPLTF